MSENNNPRRSFLKTVAAGSLSTLVIPGSLAASENKLINPENEKAKGLTFLFQGDSITDGNRGRNTDPNHIMGHGYAFSIASRIGCDFPEKTLRFINRGISGNKVTDLDTRWEKDALDLKPDVLSILIGVNDASSVVLQREPRITVERYEEVYKGLLDKTLEKFPDIVFVLCEPFILKVGRVKDNWEAYYSDIVKRQAIVRKLVSQYNAVFVGFQQIFDKACDKAPADYWIWDGVHPTVPGHELMAREWIKQVSKRIKFLKKEI